jgi:hypothetical protein
MRTRLLFSVLVSLPALACAAEAEDPASSSDSDLRRHASDAGVDAASDAATDDGTPQHLACTSTLGTQLSGGSHGRLDGYLVSIIPSHTYQCHGDSSHVHLQIARAGARYDVAVNVDQIALGEVDAPLPQPWSEGWHASASLDYVQDLGIHSSGFQSMDQTTAQRQVLSELASANHISVYATKYNLSGIHLVHRSRSFGHGLDGAIVLNPTSAKPHYLLFRFPDQSF